MRVAVIYQSEEGHTHDIAVHLGGHLEDAGLEVSLYRLPRAPADLGVFDAVVIGGSVHLGRFGKELAQYVRAHLEQLVAKKASFFSVSLFAASPDPVHRKFAAETVESFLLDLRWEPARVAAFGGALAYTKYGLPKRFLLRHIAGTEGLETDTSRDWDHTDWSGVDAFAEEVEKALCAKV